MKDDIQILRDLPLKELISAPINAVIEAQADAAMTTVAFIESVGMIPQSGATSLLDLDNTNTNPTPLPEYDIRMTKFKVNKVVNGTVEFTEVELPYIALFKPPSFEINALEWDFNVRLKSVQSFSMESKTSVAIGTSLTTEGQINIKKRLKVGTTLKVETAMKTDFEMRYKSDREQEYNLHIKVNANSAPLPNGITKLLDIIESIATKEV